MGGTNFQTVGVGRDVKEAYQNAVREATYEHGHGGYTGTIAEKDGWAHYIQPARTNAQKYIDAVWAYQWWTICKERVADDVRRGCMPSREDEKVARKKSVLTKALQKHEHNIARMAKVADDKWGPAVALELTGKDLKEAKERMGLKGTKKKVFLFFGMASC